MSKNVKVAAIVVTGVLAGVAISTKVIKTIKARKNNTEEASK